MEEVMVVESPAISCSDTLCCQGEDMNSRCTPMMKLAFCSYMHAAMLALVMVVVVNVSKDVSR